jgi:ubiquinone biosynthesis protein
MTTESSTAIRTLVRNRARVEQILRTLARYGYASWVSRGLPESLSSAAAAVADQEAMSLSDGERVRRICLDLGTTFIKIGQMLSTRADLVGAEIAEALQSLQSDVPPDPEEDVRATIREEVGAEPDEVFGTFDPKPLGSASIGQVHAATLADGSEVVVKIQHRGIGEVIETDLRILGALAALLEANDPDMAVYRPVAVVEQLRRSLLAEINFGLEAANLTKFGANFAAEPDVVIPTPHPQLCSQRMLTMSRLDGPSLSSEITTLGDRAEPFVHRGAEVFIEMIFRDGLFHADPHPGNLVVLEDDRIGLLDFGKVGRIDENTQDMIDDLVIAALSEDLEGLLDGLVQLTDAPPDLDRGALRSDVSTFMDQYVRVGSANIDVSGLGEAMTDIMQRHRMFMPPDVALLLRTLTQLQGMLVQSGVDLRVIDVLAPYQSMIAAKKFAPDKLMRRARRRTRDWERLVDTLPGEATAILQGLRSGQVDVPLRVEHLDRNVNRLVQAIITAALFSGSARLWSARVPPVAGDLSVPGAVGTVTATYLAARLLRASRRSGGIG